MTWHTVYLLSQGLNVGVFGARIVYSVVSSRRKKRKRDNDRMENLL